MFAFVWSGNRWFMLAEGADRLVNFSVVYERQLPFVLVISDELEVDGLIIVRMYRDSSDGDDTLNVAPFVHFVDMHYQVDRFATLNRNPNFYV